MGLSSLSTLFLKLPTTAAPLTLNWGYESQHSPPEQIASPAQLYPLPRTAVTVSLAAVLPAFTASFGDDGGAEGDAFQC